MIRAIMDAVEVTSGDDGTKMIDAPHAPPRKLSG